MLPYSEKYDFARESWLPVGLEYYYAEYVRFRFGGLDVYKYINIYIQ